MRRALWRGSFSLLLVGAVLGGTNGTAGATTCDPSRGASPQAIASGTATTAGGEPFFAYYDQAVLGTVVSVEELGERPSPVEVTMDVVLVLGSDEAPGTMVLSSPDNGLMGGYNFTEGVSYMVPLRSVGPDGRPNYTFVCDPISQVAEVSAVATELEGLATSSDTPFAVAGTDDAAGSSSRALGGWIAGSLGIVVIVITGLALGRRSAARQQSNP